ncbi:MAG: septum formation initiator family protein [Bacteroidaceae bacterium]|nr:septum formation initiator family protein [Bacteroidaceae bacterium]MBQ2167274.1 septum formation initiator family protein [Bacteroidaceae bacterium]MBQ2181441.1 septum formation initiator family protein [Bacteroidaceae bacterium]MBQ2585876.1 septum formation initiator family protein [Bacteroidaceae bacterium]
MKNFYSKFKYSIKYMVALGIFIAMIGFVGEHCLRERYKRKVEITELQMKIKEQRQKFNKDNKELERLKKDPEAVRKVAREKYFMKTSNEDVFIIEDE